MLREGIVPRDATEVAVNQNSINFLEFKTAIFEVTKIITFFSNGLHERAPEVHGLRQKHPPPLSSVTANHRCI
jgi:hypothetical protein